jgi:hypothetical protein
MKMNIKYSICTHGCQGYGDKLYHDPECPLFKAESNQVSDDEAFRKYWIKEFVRGVGMAGNVYYESPASIAQRNRKAGAKEMWSACARIKDAEIARLQSHLQVCNLEMGRKIVDLAWDKRKLEKAVEIMREALMLLRSLNVDNTIEFDIANVTLKGVDEILGEK